jgi:hypothetical protein
MFEKLASLFTNNPQDVQVWKCDPLVVTLGSSEVAYAHKTDLEFTPLDSPDLVGKAIAMTPDPEGIRPEITIISRLYIDAPSPTPRFARRQGIVLTGVDQFDEPVTWYVNGAADHFLTESSIDIEFDEETSKVLEEEIGTNVAKLNLTTIL